TDLRTWTALKATIGGASVVGIDGLTIAVHNLSVAINQGAGTKNGVANTKVADFAPNALNVRTGPSSTLAIDFEGNDGALLKIARGLELGIFGFFFLDGTFAIEKQGRTSITVTDGTTPET